MVPRSWACLGQAWEMEAIGNGSFKRIPH